MGKLFTDKMSSAEKRKVQRRLERASMPPRISIGSPGVAPRGYLDTETSRQLPSTENIANSSPRSQKTKKTDRKSNGKERTEETSRKIYRRASIQERMRENAYHSLLHSGKLPKDLQVIDDVDTNVQGYAQSEPSKEESSKPRQLQLTPPIPDVPVWSTRRSMVSVLCGRQDPNSWYFTRRLVRIPGNKGDDQVSLLEHQNIDPDAAELHRLWRHTGIIPTRYRDTNFDPNSIDPQHTWIACWPLINAAVYGSMLEDGEFVDRVMDLLEEKIVKGVRPDIDTISHIFGEKRHHNPVTLQHFLIDRWIENSAGGFDDIDPLSLPELFVCTALETATRRLSSVSQSSSLSSCRYHTHLKSEDCYKKRIMPAEILRQERYKYRREKAFREAEQVAADSIQFGIATVDWECRRAQVHRALHSQVDEYSATTSSRMETSGQELERSQSERLDMPDDVRAPERETGSGSYRRVRSSSSSSSVFGTAQADRAVDEMRFAPPEREPPPPPPTSSSVKQCNIPIRGNQNFEALSAEHRDAMSVYGDATPVSKSEENSESTPSSLPAITSEPDARAQAVSDGPRAKESVRHVRGQFQNAEQEA